MIDYTAMIDRVEDFPGQPVTYELHELKPPNTGPAEQYTYAGPDVLHYPPNKDPMLSKVIALEIRRKIEAMKLDLG